MSKQIPFEEKICAVKEYLKGNTSQGEQAQRLGVKVSSFQEMVAKYETFGEEGLRKGKQNNQYSAETKRMAVESYLNGEGSQAEICKRYKIRSKVILRKWIQVYNGHKELRPSRGRGSEIYMTKGKSTTYEERLEIVSHCIEHGNDYSAAIEKYGVSYQQIYSWVRKYNEKGAEGLVDKRGKRKPESEMTELERLRAENKLLAARNKRLETECAVLKKLEEIERRWR